ncbi:P-loop NTPase fold protein [Streptomyces tendae]
MTFSADGRHGDDAVRHDMPMSDARFFNDEPFLGDEGPDLLGREQYAQHALELLGRVRAQTETGVLALIGPWGSGKSSVLGKVIRLLQRQDDREDWLVAELNPWLSGRPSAPWASSPRWPASTQKA